ncbi:MAG: efflux transporter outer membrane subunit [Janthinobacterium lividum]
MARFQKISLQGLRRSSALALLACAGCAAVGPNFQRPEPVVPKQWHGATPAAGTAGATAAGTAADTTTSVTSASPATAASGSAATGVAGTPRGTGRNRQTSPGATNGEADRVPGADAPVAVPESRITQADADPRWWMRFNDPELNSLIERAVAGNIDLQEAVLRIAASRAQEQAARAAGLPNIHATASYNREQLGLEGLLKDRGVYSGVNSLAAPNSALNQYSPGLGNTASNAGSGLLGQLTSPVNLFQVGFDASWELDLFGRVRRSVEAAGAQTSQQIENRNDALVSLEAEVAQTYARLRGAQAARAVAQQEVEAEQGIVELTNSQYTNGLGSQTDAASAAAQLRSAQAQLPQYEQSIGQAINSLSLLLGEPPGTLDDELSRPGAIPPTPPEVPVGLPATLVRRRPDIRAAEAGLHAATAQVGVAVAQLFPDVSLTGNLGLRATDFKYLTRWSSHFYSFGPSISLPIFQGGALVANIRLNRAEQAAAALEYRRTVLSALNDVENALIAYRTGHEQREALTQSVAASTRALELAREAYRHGLTPFIDVLNGQRTVNESRQSLTQATLTDTTNLVALYKALGGGWQDAPQQNAAPAVGSMGNAGVSAAPLPASAPVS